MKLHTVIDRYIAYKRSLGMRVRYDERVLGFFLHDMGDSISIVLLRKRCSPSPAMPADRGDGGPTIVCWLASIAMHSSVDTHGVRPCRNGHQDFLRRRRRTFTPLRNSNACWQRQPRCPDPARRCIRIPIERC